MPKDNLFTYSRLGCGCIIIEETIVNVNGKGKGDAQIIATAVTMMHCDVDHYDDPYFPSRRRITRRPLREREPVDGAALDRKITRAFADAAAFRNLGNIIKAATRPDPDDS
jgi:hypothetical protein